MKSRLPYGETTLQEIAEFYPALALVAGATLRLDPVDPETAEWLDGPWFCKWLHQHGMERKDQLSETYARSMNRWQAGMSVRLDHADKILTELAYSLHDLPDEMWVRPPNRGATDGLNLVAQAEVAQRHSQGESAIKLAKEFGITDRTVRNLTKKALG